jgi:beta-N-acetylhexosaminidase
MKKLTTPALWLLGLVFVFAGVDINEPYLISLRGLGAAALFVAGIVVVIFPIQQGWNKRGIAARLLVVLWCLPPISILYADVAFELCERNVLHTDVTRAHILGQHFVVGYASFEEVAPLAEKGLIAGIYITKHNIAGRSAQALKSEISALQDRRRLAGLPPLMVAADQEGGIVSHLSPPLTALPALSTLVDLPPDIRAKTAEGFGRMHGQELAALGVNRDFAPVLNLRPEAGRNRFDRNTLIGQRAILRRWLARGGARTAP